jgi:hypothetical protein
MRRTQNAILREIDVFVPTADGDWRGLDVLLDELFARGLPNASVVPTLLRVFDRIPDNDGCGVFWSIVHGVEAIDGYEPILLASHEANPTEFKQIMLRRIDNAR